MRFGTLPLNQAYGAILAHTLRLANFTIKKGRRLDGDDLEKLRSAGVAEVVAAQLDGDDLHEDDAATRIGRALAGAGLRAEEAATGRVNLFADTAGVLLVDRATVDAINRIDPGITLATLGEHAAVEAGRMVATIKIIPFAVPRTKVFDVLHKIGQRGQPIEILPYRPLKVAVISTLLPALKPSVVAKTFKVLCERLAPSGADVVVHEQVPHKAEALSAKLAEVRTCGAELIIVFGASAIVDVADVIPTAIEDADGTVLHFGMPVDPGNLLLIGELQGVPVLGAPGCARSPKENGFDWVLARILAGLNVTAEDVMRMGVGGLLMDIVSRPRPRDLNVPASNADEATNVSAVVLAAGRARRMGGPNKLFATFDGEVQIRRIVRAACESEASEVIVVTGHDAERVASALDGLDVRLLHNPDYADGMSTSVGVGISAVHDAADAALVLLSDMPRIDRAAVNKLIEAYDPPGNSHIVLATADGKRGNPVLWSRRFFADLQALRGDVGARHLIAEHPETVIEVELGEAAALDIDTPDAVKAAGGDLSGA